MPRVFRVQQLVPNGKHVGHSDHVAENCWVVFVLLRRFQNALRPDTSDTGQRQRRDTLFSRPHSSFLWHVPDSLTVDRLCIVRRETRAQPQSKSAETKCLQLYVLGRGRKRRIRSARAPARRQSVAEIPKSHERDVWGN